MTGPTDWPIFVAVDGLAGVPLTVAGVVIAGIGAMMWWLGSRTARGERRPRPPAAVITRRVRPVVLATVVAGVIAAVQWASLCLTSAVLAWALVLGLPAFLAGATVVRLLAVMAARAGRREGRPNRGDDAVVGGDR
jgi:hypothetical protein